MIDYDATLKMFFAEVVKYLEKLQRNAEDEIQSNRCKAAIDVVQRIANNPMKYADYNVRVKDGMETDDFVKAFVPTNTRNNALYLVYSVVVNSMGDLHSHFDFHRKQAQQKLLNALKGVKYINSTNLLKDFTFKFKSPKSFAVQSTKQHQI